MVWQSAEGEIAVIGVFVDLDNGAGAGAGAAAAATVEPAAAKLRRQHHPHSSRQAPEVAAAAEGGAFGGIQGFVTLPMTRAAGVSSNLLETVLSRAQEIATPGTAVKTQPLVMSELVNTLIAGSFQR